MANEPVHEIRFGLIKCEIFRNHTRVGDRFNVTVTRLYRDGAVWKHSKKFGRDDCPLLCKAVDAAHTWIFAHSQAEPAAKTGGATTLD